MSSPRVWMHAAGSGGGGTSARSAGAVAAARWLAGIGATPAGPRWHVEVVLGTAKRRPPTDYDEKLDTRFQLGIYAEEWGVFCCHDGKASWIRVVDAPFVHIRDELGLLARMPSLADIGALVRQLEAQHGIHFERTFAAIKTNLPGIEGAIAAWVAAL